MKCRHLFVLLLVCAASTACSLDTAKKLGCQRESDCERGLVCSPHGQCVAPEADSGTKSADSGSKGDAGTKADAGELPTDAGTPPLIGPAPTIWLLADRGVSTYNGPNVWHWAGTEPASGYVADTSAIETERPTLDAKGGPTGGPAVHFDGEDDYMTFGDKTLYSTKGGMTFFAVVRSDEARSQGAAGIDPMLLDFGKSGGADICLFYDYQTIGVRAPDSAATPDCDPDGDTITVGPTSHTPNQHKWAIATFEIIFKDQLRVRFNGMEIDHKEAPNLTELTATEVPASSTREECVGPITLGWQAKTQATGYRNFAGYLAELRAYTTSLSEADRDAIECQLSQTYKLPLMHDCKGGT